MSIKRSTITWTGPGSPIWSGPPTQETIRAIARSTQQDAKGRLFFNDPRIGGVRRLRTPMDYQALNSQIDKYRKLSQ